MTDLRIAAQQALEALIENARLLGATQAKKGFGCYSQEDARLERAWHEGIAKHSAALRAALAQQAEPVEPITRLFGTLPVHDAQQAEAAPFGCVTVRRLSLRHENHADQYQFYPAGQSPYLDNVDECHIVYTAPPKLVPLTDEEIVKIRISLPHFVPSPDQHPYEWAIRYARAVERALEEKNRGR